MTQITINNLVQRDFENPGTLEPIGSSPFGNVIYDDLTFPAGSYKTLEGVTIEYEEVKLVSVQYTVNLVENIVRTAVSGRNGTVKEYVNQGDYVMRCTTVIINNEGIFPPIALDFFTELARAPQAVPVISKILNATYAIDNVVLSEFIAGFGNGIHTIPVTFTLESDEFFDLNEFIITQ